MRLANQRSAASPKLLASDGPLSYAVKSSALQAAKSLQFDKKSKTNSSDPIQRDLEETSDMVFIRDIDTYDIIAVSPRAAERWGTTVDDLVSGRFDPVFNTPEYQPDGRRSLLSSKEYLKRAFAGEDVSFDWRYRTREGAILDTTVQMTPEPDDKRRLVRIVVEDSGDQRDQNAQFRSLFECAPQAALLYDLDRRRVLAANQSAAAFWETSVVAMEGESFDPVAHSGLVDRHSNSIEGHLFRTSEHFAETREWYCRTARGNVRRAAVHVAHCPDPQRRLICIFVSESAKGAETDKELSAIGDVIGGIAHRFNNMFTVISGNMELLQADLKDPLSREMTRDVINAINLGADTVRQMLIYSGRSNRRPVELKLDALMHDLRGWIQQNLPADIVVETMFDHDLAPIHIDRVEAADAVKAALLNARDAMPEGGQVVVSGTNQKVSDDGSAPSGDYVRLSVEDSGSGIKQDLLKRAFDPFFTTKRGRRNNGLGLSLVYGVAKHCGGFTRLQPRAEGGTRLDLFIPAKSAN